MSLGGTFSQSMKHPKNVSYLQGAKTDKKNRNSEKWQIEIIPRVCLSGGGLILINEYSFISEIFLVPIAGSHLFFP